ncbi:hypothetical protein PYW07_006281 [Mythimna separata]|uniref:Pre-C2HC domain-containing protein n=1 Tax=Mythimna separata TaxID=271217 RepID=A0AAD8DWE1_MYTSE|nr:hypothetical protein PYW07_006281 [Mythimna separata]
MMDADLLAFFRVLLEDDEFLAKYGKKIAAFKRKPSTPPFLDSPLSPMPADRGTFTKQGIKVQVPTATDYRDLTRSLRERNVPFHTYALPEDTPTRVVIKRVQKEIATSDIKADLISQDIPVQAVHRLHRARGHIEYDMVLVVCDPSPGHHPIFQIRSVCSLTGIFIEKPYKPHLVGQCHNCQLYGHAARNCFATPRCVKCLGQHGTVDCPRPKDRNLEDAVTCQQGIKVQVSMATDYRDLTRSLRERNVPFHTYTLPEDTPTRVVIKSVPKEIATSDIKADLVSQDIPVQAVHRLQRARGSIEYDMVLVVCEPTPGHHSIFKVKSVCSLTGIAIEKPYQLYGHAQKNCFATPSHPPDNNVCILHKILHRILGAGGT